MIDGILDTMQHVQTAYSYFGGSKKKERFDVILEPMQAVSQLAFLKFCPVGTKLSIETNLLRIQLPHVFQGVTRSWNKDKREDVLLLFNAVQRYNKMYVAKILDVHGRTKDGHGSKKKDKHGKDSGKDVMSNERDEEVSDGSLLAKNLIELLSRQAIGGIDNLINTYSHVDNTSIVQTLGMYKSILLNPERFSTIGAVDENISKNHTSGKNMEEVFSQISDLWSEDEMSLLYHTLRLLEKDPSHYETYIAGLSTSLTPLHQRIRQWMSDNIVY